MTNYEKYDDLYHAEEKRIEDLINNGTLHSLRAIKKRAYTVYETGALLNVFFDPVYGVDHMIKELLSSYIIYCAAKKIIPEIGFDKEEA